MGFRCFYSAALLSLLIFLCGLLHAFLSLPERLGLAISALVHVFRRRTSLNERAESKDKANHFICNGEGGTKKHKGKIL